MMTAEDIQAITACVAQPDRVLTNPQIVQRLSRDFYWYSPVLKKLLDDKQADAIVQPGTTAEIVQVLACCYARTIPVTARGAGTGNYGQAIPLHGGIVLDLARLDKIEQITAEGVAVTGPGVRGRLGVALLSKHHREGQRGRLPWWRLGWHRLRNARRFARLRHRPRD
jgi:FAD/FMN-containing dehydrogenase